MRSGLANELKNLVIGKLLQVNIRLVVSDSMKENYDMIEDLQRKQLDQGKTADGTDIKPFYKKITIVIKKKKGQPTDRVTLKDKGGVYAGIRARPGANGETEITSTDPKTPDLIRKYTASIFGLSVASKEELGQRLTPSIQDNFRKRFNR